MLKNWTGRDVGQGPDYSRDGGVYVGWDQLPLFFGGLCIMMDMKVWTYIIVTLVKKGILHLHGESNPGFP